MKKQIKFMLNGSEVSANVSTGDSLLDVLRDEFKLGGARESCGLGLCGACTVMVSGNPVSGCLYLAPAVDGEAVITVEGLESADGALHPVQQAFLDNIAFQCGYCTPGMILMAMKLLEENPQPTEQQIKDYMSGNICRCASYKQIIAAIEHAAKLMEAKTVKN
jgi:carbon-monoxide dehydrogenase small subunit